VYDEIDTIIWPSVWLNQVISSDDEEEIQLAIEYGGEPAYVTKTNAADAELLRCIRRWRWIGAASVVTVAGCNDK
jgi:hypothetical protein